MSLIMREFEWVENEMKMKSLPSKPYNLLLSMAKYFSDKGYNKPQIKKKLREYILTCNPDAAIYKDYGNTLDKVLSYYQKRDPVHVDCVTVTVPEIASINSIESKQAKRVAFAVLCIAKFKDSLNPQNNHWVGEQLSAVMKSANVRTSIKRQCLIYNDLKECGMIEFAKQPDNNNVQVLFMQDGDVAMRITSLDNLGYRYLMYCGEPYFECQECGSITKYRNKIKGKNQKYCDSCAPVVAKEQRYQSNKQRRESNKIIENEKAV